jgi:cell division inhibitor SepF
MFNQSKDLIQEDITMAFMDKVKGMLGIPEDAEEMYEDENLLDGEEGDSLSEEGDSAKTSIFGKSVSSDTKQNKVVNIHTTTQLQVVLVKPEKFDDARPVADHLNSKHTVVLNLEATNKEVSRRLIDFLSGVAYANNGQIKRVANSTYIITPYNVQIYIVWIINFIKVIIFGGNTTRFCYIRRFILYGMNNHFYRFGKRL